MVLGPFAYTKGPRLPARHLSKVQYILNYNLAIFTILLGRDATFEDDFAYMI